MRRNLLLLSLAATAGYRPGPSLATRRAALARAAAVAVPSALWQQLAVADDDALEIALAKLAKLEAAMAEKEAADAAAAAAAAPPEVVPPPAPPAVSAPPMVSAFNFDVPFRGEPREIKPFLGKASLIVNVKYDDPETLEQMPAIGDMIERYGRKGLHVLAFPTDQGWFEAEDSNTLRLRFKSVYDFGQFPSAVVFDKTDLLGGNALPLYTWMTQALANPWGVNRLVFNYEKFLVDANGQPLRRYPRKYPVQLMDADVQAVLEGLPLPPVSASYTRIWEESKREAIKSEYAFKPGLNYYASGSPAS